MLRSTPLHIILFFFLAASCFAQNKGELESRRKKLIKDIELTTAQLKKNKKSEKLAVDDLLLINTELKKRLNLLQVLEQESQLLQKKEGELNDALSNIQAQINRQKRDYALVLNKAHISARMRHPFQEMLEGAGVFESFKKWIYLGQLKTFVLRKWDQLKTSQEQMESQRIAILNNKKEQAEVIEQVKKEESDISARKDRKKDLLANLQKSKTSLENSLKKKNNERKAINAQIEKLILAELSKKRKQSASDSKVEVALSKNFESNKGKLPWPVSEGVITGRYGRIAHPDLRGVYTDNAGLDFLANSGTPVRAVFSGTVVGTTKIPGQQFMVIISHGQFFTVYSKLQSVNVQTGQNVDLGTTLGQLGVSRDGMGNFHFEVWKGKAKQNPQLWISN